MIFSAASAWAHGGKEAVSDAMEVRARLDRLRAEGLGELVEDDGAGLTV